MDKEPFITPELCDLFDRRLDGQLSEQESRSFDTRLRGDAPFAQAFARYLAAVRGICTEAQQEAAEFAAAMRRLSPEKLREAIAPEGRRAAPPPAAVAPAPVVPRRSRQPLWQRWYVWCGAAAASVVVAVSLSFAVQRHADHVLDDTIAAYNYLPPLTRVSLADGTELPDDISDFGEQQLRDALPEFVRLFAEAPDDSPQQVEDAGVNLAMLYLRLHEREAARQTLREVMARLPGDREAQARCLRLIGQIK